MAFVVKTLYPAKLKNWDFRTDIKPNAKQVTDASADVHAAAAGQFELAGCIAFVFHWQERWRQKRRSTLTAVCMPCKNPTLILTPHRPVCGIGIVAEDQRGRV
jgi:hypothetical protein